MKKLVIFTLLLSTCMSWSFSSKNLITPIGGGSTTPPKGNSGPLKGICEISFKTNL